MKVKAVNRVKKGTQASMIKAVKWPKVTQGTSHLERFFEFSSDLGDVIRKISEAHMTRTVKKQGAGAPHVRSGQAVEAVESGK